MKPGESEKYLPFLLLLLLLNLPVGLRLFNPFFFFGKGWLDISLIYPSLPRINEILLRIL